MKEWNGEVFCNIMESLELINEKTKKDYMLDDFEIIFEIFNPIGGVYLYYFMKLEEHSVYLYSAKEDASFANNVVRMKNFIKTLDMDFYICIEYYDGVHFYADMVQYNKFYNEEINFENNIDLNLRLATTREMMI